MTDVYQEVALSRLEGKPVTPSIARKRIAYDHLPRIGEGGARMVPEPLTPQRAAGLVSREGPDVLLELEGMDPVTVQVARLLIEGHTDGRVRHLTGLSRREFEDHRERLVRLFS